MLTEFILLAAVVVLIAFLIIQMVWNTEAVKRITALQEKVKEVKFVTEHSTGYAIPRDNARAIRLYDRSWSGKKPTETYLYFKSENAPDADYAMRDEQNWGEFKFYKEQEDKEVKYGSSKK